MFEKTEEVTFSVQFLDTDGWRQWRAYSTQAAASEYLADIPKNRNSRWRIVRVVTTEEPIVYWQES